MGANGGWKFSLFLPKISPFYQIMEGFQGDCLIKTRGQGAGCGVLERLPLPSKNL